MTFAGALFAYPPWPNPGPNVAPVTTERPF